MFKIKEVRNHAHINCIHRIQFRSTKTFFHGLSSCKTSCCVILVTGPATINLLACHIPSLEVMTNLCSDK